MREPWQLNARTSGGLSLIPQDLRYFNEHFIGRSMISTWIWPPEFLILKKSGRRNDFLVWHTSAPVVSEKALFVLSSASAGDFETLPFSEIRGMKYYAINVLNICDCIDFNLSKIDFYGDDEYGTPRDIKIKRSASLPNGIFKMRRIPGYVFVSNLLADKLIAQGLTGFGLTRLSTDVLARGMRGQVPNDHPDLEPCG